jgi:hypothetical protein
MSALKVILCGPYRIFHADSKYIIESYPAHKVFEICIIFDILI